MLEILISYQDHLLHVILTIRFLHQFISTWSAESTPPLSEILDIGSYALIWRSSVKSRPIASWQLIIALTRHHIHKRPLVQVAPTCGNFSHLGWNNIHGFTIGQVEYRVTRMSEFVSRYEQPSTAVNVIFDTEAEWLMDKNKKVIKSRSLCYVANRAFLCVGIELTLGKVIELVHFRATNCA